MQLLEFVEAIARLSEKANILPRDFLTSIAATQEDA